jgi:release factor glutamine methyltransferase
MREAPLAGCSALRARRPPGTTLHLFAPMNAGNAPEKPRDARAMLRMAREFLVRRGVDEARLEAELLVAHALSLTRLELFLALDRPVVDDEIDRARDLLVRRGRREPAAYIIGRREFYGRPFKVGPGVLIPRPETELLVDRAREIIRDRSSAASARLGLDIEANAQPAASSVTSSLSIADVGTGSGCIAITLALEIDGARVVAIDVSLPAIEIARENADALGARIDLRQGDGLEVLRQAVNDRMRGFDLIVSNPPYILLEEATTLAPEVREHEPSVALFAPAGDPDHWVRKLLEAASDALAPGGSLLVELGATQGRRVLELALKKGWRARLHRDLAGFDRVLEAHRE